MRVGIIGAGVIGVSAAHALMRDGHDVTLFDRDGICEGASLGNAGAFAFSDIIPLATPGILLKAPKWLFDPLGPLSIRPSYLLRLLPWMMRFARASMPDRYASAVASQAALMTYSQDALNHFVVSAGMEHLLRREGQLQIYNSADTLNASQKGWEERAEAGIRFDTITSHKAISDIQPGVDPRFSHAVFTPDWINVTDPKVWVEAIAEDAMRHGVTLHREAVVALHSDDNGARLFTASGEHSFDRVVVAAGAFCTQVLNPLGLHLPLDTERGYNTTLPAGAFDLRTHVTFADHGFVVTKIGDGVRVGGAVELGGLNLPPNMARAKALLDKAQSFLPALNTEGGTQWMGFRPSMPDSLPVIGAAPGARNIILAFGHGHLGLTQSQGTADMVADIVSDRPSNIDRAPYAPERFTGHRA